jgi:hypothetical protein
MTKRATRWKAEVVHGSTDEVQWEVLVHDFPEPALRTALGTLGFKIRRANTPKLSGPLPYVYSELDPKASITAAREHAVRRETQMGNALMLLLDRANEWVPRADVRKVAGDSGDRRVRELRDRNWPIAIAQLNEGEPWHVKMELPRHFDDREPWDEPKLPLDGQLRWGPDVD